MKVLIRLINKWNISSTSEVDCDSLMPLNELKKQIIARLNLDDDRFSLKVISNGINVSYS